MSRVHLAAHPSPRSRSPLGFQDTLAAEPTEAGRRRPPAGFVAPSPTFLPVLASALRTASEPTYGTRFGLRVARPVLRPALGLAFLLLALWLAPLPATAGPNADGVLLLHFDRISNPTCDPIPYCGKLDFQNCDEAVTRVEDLGYCDYGAWVFAAFPEGAMPRVTSVSFGLQVTPPETYVVTRDVCGSAGESPGAGWPAVNSGTTVSWSEAQNDLLLEVYVFFPSGYGYYGGGGEDPFHLQLTPHPTLGGVFADDSVPPVLDTIVDYGAFGFRTDGYLPACPPAGACCFDDGSCTRVRPSICATQGGDYQGDATDCDPTPCAAAGACCFADGTCTVLTGSACLDASGNPQGNGTSCAPNPCPQPSGACCFSDLACAISTPPDCVAAGGSFLGADTVCDPGTCGGACCTGLSCVVLLAADCATTGGTYIGDAISCDPSACQSGACCLDGTDCEVLAPYACADLAGIYLGAESTCEPETCAEPLGANRYFVKPDGTGDYPTIQAALASGKVTSGVTIELAEGVFVGAGNRDVDFLGKAVLLRSRSGDPSECILDIEGFASPGRGLLLRSGEGPGTEISGITFRNGRILGSGFEGGAGVLIEAPAPENRPHVRIANCRFEDNVGVYGAALQAWQPAWLEVVDCVFEGNGATVVGGATHFVACDSARVERCTFGANGATSLGGAVSILLGTPEFVDCAFLGNSSKGGGAVLIDNGATPQFTRCWFAENDADDWGGGAIYCYPGDGGAAFDDCGFFRNTATSEGGAVWTRLAAPVFRGCSFSENGAPWGGTISNEYGSPHFTRSILAFGDGGAAVGNEGSEWPSFSCSDIYGNAGGDWTGGIAVLEGVDGNFSWNPVFCGQFDAPLALHAGSPCLPGNHPDGADCGLIGAYGIGCGPVDVPEGGPVLPRELTLRLARPNPVRGSLAFVLALPAPTAVSFALVDVSGRVVRRLHEGLLSAGVHEVTAPVDGIEGGVYFARLVAGDEFRAQKVVLIP